MCAKEVIDVKSPGLKLHLGEGGASALAYITVAVGNHIHQIKSSIYLCGSGDSGGGVGERGRRGDIGDPGVRQPVLVMVR